MVNVRIPKGMRITKKDFRVLKEVIHLLYRDDPTAFDAAFFKLMRIAERAEAMPYKPVWLRWYQQRHPRQ